MNCLCQLHSALKLHDKIAKALLLLLLLLLHVTNSDPKMAGCLLNIVTSNLNGTHAWDLCS